MLDIKRLRRVDVELAEVEKINEIIWSNFNLTPEVMKRRLEKATYIIWLLETVLDNIDSLEDRIKLIGRVANVRGKSS